MSANRLFLVCAHHAEPENALCLAERLSTRYEASMAVDDVTMDAWFAKHAECGKTRDHYSLAYGFSKDWDCDKPKVNAAVADAINGSH